MKLIINTRQVCTFNDFTFRFEKIISTLRDLYHHGRQVFFRGQLYLIRRTNIIDGCIIILYYSQQLQWLGIHRVIYLFSTNGLLELLT